MAKVEPDVVWNGEIYRNDPSESLSGYRGASTTWAAMQLGGVPHGMKGQRRKGPTKNKTPHARLAAIRDFYLAGHSLRDTARTFRCDRKIIARAIGGQAFIRSNQKKSYEAVT